MGWYRTIFWALFMLVLLAALADNNAALVFWLLSPFFAIIALIVLFIFISPIVLLRNSWMKRRAFVSEYGEQEEQSRQGQARLTEAFKPLVEFKHELDQRRLEWMREQARTTDKVEYRKVLEEHIDALSNNDALKDFKKYGSRGIWKHSVPSLPVHDILGLPDSGAFLGRIPEGTVAGPGRAGPEPLYRAVHPVDRSQSVPDCRGSALRTVAWLNHSDPASDLVCRVAGLEKE